MIGVKSFDMKSTGEGQSVISGSSVKYDSRCCVRFWIDACGFRESRFSFLSSPIRVRRSTSTLQPVKNVQRPFPLLGRHRIAFHDPRQSLTNAASFSPKPSNAQGGSSRPRPRRFRQRADSQSVVRRPTGGVADDQGGSREPQDRAAAHNQ
jgi:hypothetical protein